jgi:GNAT superfamily N-acetyltransferase
MLILKNATIDDYEKVFAMVMTYAYESPYKDRINDKALEVLTKEFLEEKDKVVFYVISDDIPIGFLAGAAVPFILGLDTIATELAWWVAPKFRSNGVGSVLIEAFEIWAKELGCSIVSLSSMDKETGKIYTDRGYTPREFTYMKVLY